MAITYEDFQQGEATFAPNVPSTTGAVLEERFAQAFENNPIMATMRYFELRRDERTGPRLDAERARARLVQAGLENDIKVGDAGITEAALSTLIERKRIERRRQETFARAQGGLAENVAGFGLDILTSLSDPVGAGLNFVPVVGQARYARWLGAAGSSFVRRAGVRAGVGVLEGTAGGAIAEVPVYISRTAEQADYDMTDALLNVTLGGVTGAGLHTTVGSLGDVYRHVRGSRAERVAALKEAARREEAPPEAAAPARADPYDASPPREREGTYDVVEQELTDEQLAAFQGLRSHVPRDENVRAAGEGVSGQSRDPHDGGAGGEPLRVYRGAARDLSADDFGNEALGFATGHPSSGLGVFFTNQSDRAAQYGAVTEHHLDVRNPKRIRVEELRGFDSLEEATAFRKSLEAQGFDGIVIDASHLGGSVDYVAFNHKQVLKAPPDRPRQQTAAARANSATPQVREAALRAAVGQAVTGDRVNVDPIISPENAFHSDGGPFSRASENVDPEYRSAEAHAEEIVLAEEPDLLRAAEEEADLAIADATAIRDRLGIEREDAELNAAEEGVKTAENWAKAAEIAATCLIRGG